MSDRVKDATDSTRDETPVVSRMPSSHGGHQPHSQRASPAIGPSSSSHASTIHAGSQHERAFELPPLPGPPAPLSKHNSTTRLAGVSSILNPTLPADVYPTGPRPHIHGADPAQRGAPAFQQHDRRSPDQSFGNPSSHAPTATMGEAETRRILTPKSPSATLHRAMSLGQIKSGSREMGYQPAPFPPSPHPRSYPADSGRFGSLNQVTTSTDNRRSYGISSGELNEKNNVGPSRLLGLTPSSSTPSTPFPPYNPNLDTSPASQPGHIPHLFQTSGRHAPLTPVINSLDMPRSYGSDGGDARQHAVGIPISSSGGQNVYQMMTLETTSGRVQLPVDVQAASRVADEKRRRNAGASARFRQRRKEKEKEASSTISKLEQQVKELGEEADFYRRERDYLASVIVQMPGGERHLARAPSPRRRRTPSTGASSSTSAYHGSHDFNARSMDDGRNVRRRASSMSLGTHHTAPSMHMAGHAHSTSYTPVYASHCNYGPRPESPSSEAQYFSTAPHPSAIRSQPPPTHSGPSSRPPMVSSPSTQSGAQSSAWGPHPSNRLPPISGAHDPAARGHSVRRSG